MAGYSGKGVAEKLGVKPGSVLVALNVPAGYRMALGKLPERVMIVTRLRADCGLIHYFATDRASLTRDFLHLKHHLLPAGSLWISWPKGSSLRGRDPSGAAPGLPTDLNENIVRDIGLSHGLVDVKVMAVDDSWSALKFVYRLADRKS